MSTQGLGPVLITYVATEYHSDDEFLAARLLLLCSIHTAPDLLSYLERGGLAEVINMVH